MYHLLNDFQQRHGVTIDDYDILNLVQIKKFTFSEE